MGCDVSEERIRYNERHINEDLHSDDSGSLNDNDEDNDNNLNKKKNKKQNKKRSDKKKQFKRSKSIDNLNDTFNKRKKKKSINSSNNNNPSDIDPYPNNQDYNNEYPNNYYESIPEIEMYPNYLYDPNLNPNNLFDQEIDPNDFDENDSDSDNPQSKVIYSNNLGKSYDYPSNLRYSGLNPNSLYDNRMSPNDLVNLNTGQNNLINSYQPYSFNNKNKLNDNPILYNNDSNLNKLNNSLNGNPNLYNNGSIQGKPNMYKDKMNLYNMYNNNQTPIPNNNINKLNGLNRTSANLFKKRNNSFEYKQKYNISDNRIDYDESTITHKSNNIDGDREDTHKIVRDPTKLYYTYKCVQTINAHELEITCIIHITLTNEIASSSLDKQIKIWGTKDNIKFKLNAILKGHSNSVLSLKEFRKLRYLCSCSVDRTLKLWDLKTLKCYATLTSHTKSVLCSSYVSNKKETYIFSGGEDLLLIIWKKDKEKKYIKKTNLMGHTNSIVSLLFIDKYNYLCSGSDDKTIRIWDSNKNYDCIKIIDTINSEIDNLRYARNRIVACCEDGNIYFINVISLKKIRSVQFTKDAIYDFNLMDHEKYLLVAGTDCKGRIWEIGTSERALLIGHTKPLSGIFPLKNFNVVTSSMDGTIKIWGRFKK